MIIMKRLIICSTDSSYYGYEYIDGGRIGYTQEQLEKLWFKFDCEELDYECAKFFTETIPNSDNFYHNSIGYWEPSEQPNHESDYQSYSNNYQSFSEYWYEPEGVYRRSDHWGRNVASCSWFYDLLYRGENTYYGEQDNLEFYDEPVTGFIPWEDLKAKGYIDWDDSNEKFVLQGFNFY